MALSAATAQHPNAIAGEYPGPSRCQQWTMVMQDAEGAAGQKRPMGGMSGRGGGPGSRACVAALDCI